MQVPGAGLVHLPGGKLGQSSPLRQGTLGMPLQRPVQTESSLQVRPGTFPPAHLPGQSAELAHGCPGVAPPTQAEGHCVSSEQFVPGDLPPTQEPGHAASAVQSASGVEPPMHVPGQLVSERHWLPGLLPSTQAPGQSALDAHDVPGVVPPMQQSAFATRTASSTQTAKRAPPSTAHPIIHGRRKHPPSRIRRSSGSNRGGKGNSPDVATIVRPAGLVGVETNAPSHPPTESLHTSADPARQAIHGRTLQVLQPQFRGLLGRPTAATPVPYRQPLPVRVQGQLNRCMAQHWRWT